MSPERDSGWTPLGTRGSHGSHGTRGRRGRRGRSERLELELELEGVG